MNTPPPLWLRLLRLSFGLLMYSLVTSSWAGSLSWESLSTQERKVLQEYQTQWSKLPTDKQSALKRWAALPESQRAQIRSQYTQWNNLPLTRRIALQRKLDHYRSLPTDKREKIKKWQGWIKGLPMLEQQKLRQQWSYMSPAERRKYIQELTKKYGAPPL